MTRIDVLAVKLRWEAKASHVVAVVQTSRGTIEVSFPVPAVYNTIRRHLVALGTYLPPEVGEPIVDSVEGLFGWIKRAAKKASRAVKKATGGALRSISRAAKSIARSKALGGVLGAAAVAFPAIGAPALAAWTAANRGVAALDKAEAAAKRIERGIATATDHARVADAKRLVAGVRQLATDQSPAARLARAALRSVPGTRFHRASAPTRTRAIAPRRASIGSPFIGGPCAAYG